MKLPRIRIGTLMLLVVIAALAVALFVERRKSARAREGEMRARYAAYRSQLQAKTPASPTPTR